MRWEMLFADLESQVEAAQSLDRDAAAADLTRAEAATIVLTDRLRGLRGRTVRAALITGRDVEGEVREVFPEWVLLTVAGREAIVPLRAVESWSGIGVGAAPPSVREAVAWLRAPQGPAASSGPGARQGSGPQVAGGPRPGGSVLGLGQALRRLSRDRAVVVVQTATREYHGRIDRVGRDHFDLQPVAAQEWGDHRRPSGYQVVIGVDSVVMIGSAAL